MAAFNHVEFIGGISWRHIASYFKGNTSLFRQYQKQLLIQYSQHFTGTVIELGCEKSYHHRDLFPNVDYHCTNIDRDYDEYLDVTHMEHIQDASVDGYICVSVLEHVENFETALSEIYRTLKPGGVLLLAVPFAFCYHDQVDYWRFSQDMFVSRFQGYTIVDFIHLGSKFSAIVDELQKPRRSLQARYLIYKCLGFGIAIAGKFLDAPDGFPSGYAIYATKNP